MTPKFVEYGALVTPPAPFVSLRTQLWGFWFEADRERLLALCRKVFAEPTGGEIDVHPLGRHVMLTWGRIERVFSASPGWEERGGVAEPQVVVWVPVAFVGAGRDAPRAERFAMFVPYIWVDNAMSLATGRELFGYPKSWGWLGFPEEDSGSPRRWSVDAQGLDYARDGLAARHPLLEVVEGHGAPGLEDPELEDPEHDDLGSFVRHMVRGLWGAISPGHILHGLELAADLAVDLIDREFPHVFLKQVRSVEDGTDAALQQVTEARYHITRLRARPRLHPHTLTVHALDSQPVGDEIGLESQETELAYEVELDFEVGAGRVLWDSASRP